MLRGRREGSDARGGRDVYIHEPQELGVFGLSIPAAGAVTSRHVVTDGFEHFQVCFQTDVVGTIRVDVAKGVYRFPRGTFVSRTRSPFVTIGTVTTTATAFHPLYFGTGLAIAGGGGDTIRFGRTLTLQFTNEGAGGVFLTAWLECLG